jgi:hypothetical protein
VKKTNYNRNLITITLPLALCALLSLSLPTHAGEMQASDGAANDQFGSAVSVSGTIGLGGAPYDDIGPKTNQGSAYIFRNLHTATGTITQNAKLEASDGAAYDEFGGSVSISGTIGLVGAHLHDTGGSPDVGAVYVFRNLHTANGPINEDAKLIPSGASGFEYFGNSVSLSGTIGLVGSKGWNLNSGLAYVYRNLNTVTGTMQDDAVLVPTDLDWYDNFGWSVSLFGTIGLVGSIYHDIGSNVDQGAAYVFRNLNTLSGWGNGDDAKLVASDGAAFDCFGSSVSLFGTIGLVGAYMGDGQVTNSGSAYVFRNLHTATGTITQNAKLEASDGAANDNFGWSVSLSSTIGLVGAYMGDGQVTNSGSAYVFRNLNTATGTIKESVKLFASDGAANDNFGYSVSLNGDRFVIGAPHNDIGSNSNQGNAYFGHLRTFTTANLGGNDATATDGLSFEARDNWIIGQTTSNNSVTLTSGDSGNVGRVGLVNPTAAQTYIGQNASSNNNTLQVESGAILTSNSINVGASGNSGNELRANGTINLSSGSVLNVSDGNILSGAGTIQGDAGNTTNDVVISGSLRPGSGNLGSGIGTLTRNNGNVTWHGNASSPWVFELGIAKATMLLANTSGTRDLLDITGGDFLKGTGSSFVFDFANTGWGGWYKLVDWTGTTNFSATDFSATNINPVVTSYSFHIDNGGGSTTALYIYMIPEPLAWAVLSALLGALVVIRQRLRKDARAQTTSAT